MNDMQMEKVTLLRNAGDGPDALDRIMFDSRVPRQYGYFQKLRTNSDGPVLSTPNEALKHYFTLGSVVEIEGENYIYGGTGCASVNKYATKSIADRTLKKGTRGQFDAKKIDFKQQRGCVAGQLRRAGELV